MKINRLQHYFIPPESADACTKRNPAAYINNSLMCCNRAKTSRKMSGRFWCMEGKANERGACAQARITMPRATPASPTVE